MRKTSRTFDFNVIGVLPEGSHDFWYGHPWISSDVLVQLIFNADPLQRGLVENINEEKLRYWTFRPIIQTVSSAFSVMPVKPKSDDVYCAFSVSILLTTVFAA